MMTSVLGAGVADQEQLDNDFLEKMEPQRVNIYIGIEKPSPYKSSYKYFNTKKELGIYYMCIKSCG